MLAPHYAKAVTFCVPFGSPRVYVPVVAKAGRRAVVVAPSHGRSKMKSLALYVVTTISLLCLPIEVAYAYSGRWYVSEDLASHTCYRLTSPKDGENWRMLGVFNSFREAGTWTWEHRDVCERSPVFG